LTYRNNGPQSARRRHHRSGAHYLTSISYQSSSLITPTGLFSYTWNGQLDSGASGAIAITGIGRASSPQRPTNTATIVSDVDTNLLNNASSAGVTSLRSNRLDSRVRLVTASLT
jgi:hypothetical protein